MGNGVNGELRYTNLYIGMLSVGYLMPTLYGKLIITFERKRIKGNSRTKIPIFILVFLSTGTGSSLCMKPTHSFVLLSIKIELWAFILKCMGDCVGM